uniref:Si:dkeyp-11e3.1 n=1 Tax=Kryptolebias marmoratus TaxID=37003 RepID=A0A3Q2ZUP7_KRYMA
MEERTESPIAVKVEQNSHSVILTYFQEDINTMVDAHFTRALSKVCKPTELTGKTKNSHKAVKSGKHGIHGAAWKQTQQRGYFILTTCLFLSSTEHTNTCQDSGSYSKSQVPPVTYGSTSETPGPWNSFRTREGPGLPSIMCSLSPEGQCFTGQQYSASLLNLLHSDRGEMGPSMASSSKPEPVPGWTVPQGFRESADPPIGFEPGESETAFAKPSPLCVCKHLQLRKSCGVKKEHVEKFICRYQF